ncbi:MAG TPA: methyltransferase domain-containing protein [Thermoanaerobaculia bacterium]|nr:methyltransferase domain-containing protein [Thermoanaerobaculia bacterium]
MLPSHYFEIICCPRCRSDLAQAGENQLRCAGCAAEYPIVEGIPVLLAGGEDEVSRSVSAFYSGAWKRIYQAQPADKGVHDDASKYGARYVRRTEDRFLPVFRGKGGRRRFFLDAACGAFPRGAFGEGYEYHVCLDFTLEALVAGRRMLGERGVCVCGSLLRMPLRDGVFDGILASHCVYHIDQGLQGVALRELMRALAPGGRLAVFYANPENVSSKLLKQRRLWPLRALLALSRRYAPPPAPLVTEEGPVIYCYLHPIETMMRELTAVYPDARVEVRTLCLFQFADRAPLFQSKVLAALSYGICMGLERLYARRPDMAYYLTYVAERGAERAD